MCSDTRWLAPVATATRWSATPPGSPRMWPTGRSPASKLDWTMAWSWTRRQAKPTSRRPKRCASPIVRELSSWDSPRLREFVPNAAHGNDVLGSTGIALELLAQVADVYLQLINVAVERQAAPRERKQPLMGNDSPRIQDEAMQDLVLLGRQLNLSIGHGDHARAEVHA